MHAADATLDATEDTGSDAAAASRVLRTLTVVHPRVMPPRLLDDRPLVIGRDPGEGLALDGSRKASRRHAELRAGGRLVDLGSRNGTTVDGARLDGAPVALDAGAVLRMGDAVLVYDAVPWPPGLPPPTLTAGTSLARLRAEALADRVAATPLPVLIHGPTGAGKERLAARIHQQSGRAGALVPLNCGAVSAELVASELFGHVRGAFSGAAGARSGLFVAAERGTLFLDEIGELPLDVQPALLRAIQENRVRPVGSDRDRAIDVRYVSATHRDLRRLEADGRFRGDLFARLAGLTIALPGLAARRAEVVPLFRHFLGAEAPPPSTAAAEALCRYGWPHNVRELKFAAERARLFCMGLAEVSVELLPDAIRDGMADGTSNGADGIPDGKPMASMPSTPDRATLEALLTTHQGNVSQVADALGKHRQQVYRWLRSHRLDPAAFRP